MDDALGQNDPFRNMRTAEDDVKPEFLDGVPELNNKNDDKESKRDNKKQKRIDRAKGALQVAELAAGGLPIASGAKGLADVAGSEKLSFAFTGSGKSKKKQERFKLSGVKISAISAIIIVVIIALVGTMLLGTPIFTIGHIDMNLQDALGFSGTIRILEKQSGYVIKEMMAKGEMPDDLAGDFAAHGMMFGQVTDQGDFVRTNTYVADAGALKDLAVLGNFKVEKSDGNLAILYHDEVIGPDEFVGAIESNPELYAEYSEALDISARYYYSSDVDAVYKDMNISRAAFEDWKSTGDQEEDQEQFNEIMMGILDNKSNLVLDGCVGEESEDNYSVDVTNPDSAIAVISEIADRTKGSDATKKAAESLSSAISSSEPYLAANAFMAIEEPIQRARIDGDGPIHELMNTLYAKNNLTYVDVNTNTEVTTDKAIIETDNFVAAVSGGEFSKRQAENFSRDRGLKLTGMSDVSIITDATISTTGQKKSEIMAKMQHGSSADQSVLMPMDDSLSIAIVKKNSDLFRTVVGGNRIIEGGAFLSNSINARVLAAMPSDEETIAAYHREVKDALAWKAEAERATKSPFDITSQYTFLGSLTHGLTNTMLRNTSSDNSALGSLVGMMADLTNDSVKDLSGTVIADGKENDYGVTLGESCQTVNAAGAEGDIYCSSHNTLSTGYMKKTKEDWQASLGGNLDESGNIVSDSQLGQFIVLGMDRRSTIGVENSEVCEAWKDFNQGIIGKIIDKLLDLLGLYNSCRGVDSGVAIGSDYTFSGSNSNAATVKLYSGFVLYDTVYSLLKGKTSSVAAFREKYYQEHPLDNSPAGIIARRSGMTKAEAEAALAYIDYLEMIARYDPSTRVFFGEEKLNLPARSMAKRVDELVTELYIVWRGRTEYDDLRSRNYVA